MTTVVTYITLDDIKIIEKRKQLFNGFLTPVFIRTTAQQSISGMYKVPSGTSEKDFHSSWFRKGMILIFISVFSIPWFYLVLFWNKSPITYSLVLIALTVLLSLLFFDGFLNKKKIYEIHLDFEGITVAGSFYNWSDIQQTAILEIGAGRSQNNYLVLVFNNGRYEKFLLQAFLTTWGFRSSLSTYIEYFKNNNLLNRK